MSNFDKKDDDGAELLKTTTKIIKQYIKRANKKLTKMSREQEIRTMVEQGFNYAQIGAKFGVSRERIRQCAQKIGISQNREVKLRLQNKLRIEKICNRAGIVDTINAIKHLSWMRIAKHLNIDYKTCQQVFAKLNIERTGTRSAAELEQRNIVCKKISDINDLLDKMPRGTKKIIAGYLFSMNLISVPGAAYGILSGVIRNHCSVSKLNQIADAIFDFLAANSDDKAFQPLQYTVTEQIMTLVNQNMTGVEIASKLGISANAVWRCAKKHGVVVHTNRKKAKFIDSKQIIELAKQGLTCAEIANRLNVNQCSVYQHAKRNGIVVHSKRKSKFRPCREERKQKD